jgi:hypothetical protein
VGSQEGLNVTRYHSISLVLSEPRRCVDTLNVNRANRANLHAWQPLSAPRESCP